MQRRNTVTLKECFYHNIRPLEGCADTVCICVQNLLKREDGQKENRWSCKKNVQMQ